MLVYTMTLVLEQDCRSFFSRSEVAGNERRGRGGEFGYGWRTGGDEEESSRPWDAPQGQAER